MALAVECYYNYSSNVKTGFRYTVRESSLNADSSSRMRSPSDRLFQVS